MGAAELGRDDGLGVDLLLVGAHGVLEAADVLLHPRAA